MTLLLNFTTHVKEYAKVFHQLSGSNRWKQLAYNDTTKSFNRKKRLLNKIQTNETFLQRFDLRRKWLITSRIFLTQSLYEMLTGMMIPLIEENLSTNPISTNQQNN